MKLRSRGFSALEALIAAAILGVALAPLLDMQRHALRESAKLETMRLGLIAQRSAIDLLTSVNPMEEPDGRRTLSPTLAIEWRAEPISRTVPALGYLNQDLGIDVALYRIQVRVIRGDRVIHSFEIEKEGWRPVR